MPHPKPDEEWCTLAAELSVEELLAGRVIAPDQRKFAQEIIAQQLYILLASNCRPVEVDISN